MLGEGAPLVAQVCVEVQGEGCSGAAEGGNAEGVGTQSGRFPVAQGRGSPAKSAPVRPRAPDGWCEGRCGGTGHCTRPSSVVCGTPTRSGCSRQCLPDAPQTDPSTSTPTSCWVWLRWYRPVQCHAPCVPVRRIGRWSERGPPRASSEQHLVQPRSGRTTPSPVHWNGSCASRQRREGVPGTPRPWLKMGTGRLDVPRRYCMACRQ